MAKTGIFSKSKYLFLLLLILFCTTSDLYTKWLAKKHLQHARPITIIENYAEFRYTENTAIAFSMLQSVDPAIRKWLIYSLSSVAVIFLGILAWKVRNDSIYWLLSMSIIFSGAIGNISERVYRGYVIDFIHLHYFDRWSWPIFNVADILISCGAILLGILMLKSPPEELSLIKSQEEDNS